MFVGNLFQVKQCGAEDTEVSGTGSSPEGVHSSPRERKQAKGHWGGKEHKPWKGGRWKVKEGISPSWRCRDNFTTSTFLEGWMEFVESGRKWSGSRGQDEPECGRWSVHMREGSKLCVKREGARKNENETCPLNATYSPTPTHSQNIHTQRIPVLWKRSKSISHHRSITGRCMQPHVPLLPEKEEMQT